MKAIKLLSLCFVLSTIVFVSSGVYASDLVQQTALPGDCIPKFSTPLPVFGPAGPIPRVDALTHPSLTITMNEINQAVLPSTVHYPATYISTWDRQSHPCPVVTVKSTRIYGYQTTDTRTSALLGPANWPGVTIETRRSIPTVVTYVNKLPSFNPLNPEGPGLVQGLISLDKTIHWADPLHTPGTNPCMNDPNGPGCNQPFIGPVGAVAHLHGAENSSTVDGGPNAWFTPDGRTGPGYTSLYNAGPGKAVYVYQNAQEPGTLWFHDHLLGATRLNVYACLATFYFIRQPDNEPANLPSGPYEVEIALQDRQFDTNSQLYWPDGSDPKCGSMQVGDPCLNGPPSDPQHPFWIPEFIGDVAIANGAPWPYFNVEPRRYRFRLLDGSNARMWRLMFGAAPVYQVGADDNYFDSPVKMDDVFIAPGERADIIVDFTGLEGRTITVTNNASVPYPDGLVPGVDQPGMAQVMRFIVNKRLAGRDTSCDPAADGCKRPTPIVAFTDGEGNISPSLKIDVKRELVLKEAEDPVTGGPDIVMVNNTFWDGTKSPSIDAVFPSDGISELPRQGSVEEWDIVNLTPDAHPMHTHLVQFQVLNRQNFDVSGYTSDWSSFFPAGCAGGVLCPGYGPPLAYNAPNKNGAIGGNPAVGPYLSASPVPPEADEAGWKDTAKAYPGQVLRLLVRWTPTDTQLLPHRSFAGLNFYSFDPTYGPGYVWHCHIIDHEDNEMMRPYKVTK